MNNYTTETAQIKRGILNFCKKISKGLCKPAQKLCQDMIFGICARKSVLLTDISRGLQEDIKLAYTVDRLSGHLSNMQEEDEIAFKENYESEALKLIDSEDEYVIVLNDDTDISHEQAKKMEDLCIVKDASSKQEKYVKGYKGCEYVALSANMKSPISLYSKIYSTESDGFISENNETIIGEEKIIKILNRINKKPILVRDRGYDANEFFKRDIESDIKFITRLKKNRNLIFKNKNENAYEHVLRGKGKISIKLMYKGENRDCYISYTKVKLPCCKEKEVTLVTVYGLDYKDNDGEEEERVLMFLTNLDVKDKDNAIKIVYTYFLRWRIEEYFKAKKSYKWESSLIRSLKGINNLNMFLNMVMLYSNEHIEKLDRNFLSNILLERSLQIKEKCLVYLGQIRDGIYEILKFSKNGIKNFQNIKHKEKYKQLELIL